jgi:hypothetical protein
MMPLSLHKGTANVIERECQFAPATDEVEHTLMLWVV